MVCFPQKQSLTGSELDGRNQPKAAIEWENLKGDSWPIAAVHIYGVNLRFLALCSRLQDLQLLTAAFGSQCADYTHLLSGFLQVAQIR